MKTFTLMILLITSLAACERQHDKDEPQRPIGSSPIFGGRSGGDVVEGAKLQ